jgi:hypothetical protein
MRRKLAANKVKVTGRLQGQHGDQVSANTKNTGEGVGVADFLFPRIWIGHKRGLMSRLVPDTVCKGRPP